MNVREIVQNVLIIVGLIITVCFGGMLVWVLDISLGLKLLGTIFLICLSFFTVFVMTQKKKLLPAMSGIYFVVICSCLLFARHYMKTTPWQLVTMMQMVLSEDKKDTNLPSKFTLLKNYLKLEVEKMVKGSDYNQTNLFGYDLCFNSYSHLEFVVQEIFLRHDYFIDSGRKDPFIIDCGGNIGLAVLYYKLLYPASKILVFEADLNNFKFLKKNIEKNKLSDVMLVNKAVSSRDGFVYFQSLASLCSKVVSKAQPGAIQVASVPLSKYIDRDVDILKMDIEGAETDVLFDLDKHNKLKKIKHIIMEFHCDQNKNNNRLTDVLKLFERNNFDYKIVLAVGGALVVRADQKYNT